MQKKSIAILALVMCFISNMLFGQEPRKHSHKKYSHKMCQEKKQREKLQQNLKKLAAKQRKEDKKKLHATMAPIMTDAIIDFEVENKTGNTVYVACFSYMKKHTFERWRWNKSPVYKIDDDQKTTIKLPPIDDEQDRENTFGYLAVYKEAQGADDATYELLPDSNKLALDLLVHLKGKKVVLEVEKYGFKDDFFEYDFVRKDQKSATTPPSLDFAVENQTGKTVIVTCFVFQKKAKGTWLAEKTKADWKLGEETRDDMSLWRFDKTSIITLKHGESGAINVDTIIEGRDRVDVRGYLAIFDEDEQKKAEDSIYELLPAQNKLQLDKLANLKNKKVVLEIEEYGIADDILDYKVKPISHIDFTKIGQSKK